MRRMIVNGKRALVAFGLAEIPGSAPQAEAEFARLARDMYWLDTGIDVSPEMDREPPTRALN